MVADRFEAQAFVVEGDEVRVCLVAEHGAECELLCRVVTDEAPGYGFEQSVELVDVDGDPDGAGWLEGNRELVLRQHGWRAEPRSPWLRGVLS